MTNGFLSYNFEGRGGGATVLKCILGDKLPKNIYTLVHFNTPGNNVFIFPQKFDFFN